jgi:uncharacterized protein YraI
MRMAITKTAFLAGVALAAFGGAAFAQVPALVTRDLNLRAAPTTNSPSLGVIPGGSTIEAGPCGNGWCNAYLGGQAGFVAQMYLDFGGPAPYAYGPPPPPPPPPVVYGPPAAYGPPPPYWGWRRW